MATIAEVAVKMTADTNGFKGAIDRETNEASVGSAAFMAIAATAVAGIALP